MRMLTLTDLSGEPLLVNIELIRAIRPYAGEEAAIVFDNDHIIYVRNSFGKLSEILESLTITPSRDAAIDSLLIRN